MSSLTLVFILHDISFFLIFHTQLYVKIFDKDEIKNMYLLNQGYTGSLHKKHHTFQK